jgi:hypothetical protein
MLTHEMRLIETPNTETLYSIAVVDLNDGPVVVVHPDFGDRYFRTSIWELHGDTRTISQKHDGGHPPAYAILPLDWQGAVPPDLKSYRIRSRYVQFAPHIAVYGESDLPAVHALQDGLKLIRLSDWGGSNQAMAPGQPMRPIRRPGTKTPTELLFFEELGETLKDLTVRDDEMAFARQVERIGITLKDGFRAERLDAPVIAGLKRAVLDAQSILEQKSRTLFPPQPGGTWLVSTDATSLDDWLLRGTTGWKHVWGDLASELMFPMARTDGDGQPMTGDQRYTIHFPPGDLPPSRYWRITMYDLAGFLVANPIKRYGIGNMAETLQPNADGSLTLSIQHDSPGPDKEVNWLPAPPDGFFLVMRMYQPEERMYRGKYIVPPVQRVTT